MNVVLVRRRQKEPSSNIVLHKVKAEDVDIIREKGTVVAASK